MTLTGAVTLGGTRRAWAILDGWPRRYAPGTCEAYATTCAMSSFLSPMTQVFGELEYWDNALSFYIMNSVFSSTFDL